MRKFLILSIAGMMLASPGAMIAPAAAQDVRIEVGPDGVRVRDRDRERRERFERREERREDRREDRRDRRGCSVDRALDKAERLGLRRVRVLREGRRTIEVGGRDRRGDRRVITFGRDRGCPVY